MSPSFAERARQNSPNLMFSVQQAPDRATFPWPQEIRTSRNFLRRHPFCGDKIFTQYMCALF